MSISRIEADYLLETPADPRRVADFMAGDVEILRGDLGRILHDATRDDADYIFGETITDLAQDASGVDVYVHAAPPQLAGSHWPAVWIAWRSAG